jgi:F-type H+-transporting ATPase subunit epsilon
MAKSDRFQCSVVTPERKVLECDATFVAFPAHDGEMGVLVDRAPLVCKLGIGVLRIEAGETKHHFFIDGGFAQMVNNRLTILTQQAKPASEIDAAKAREKLAEARAMPMLTDEDFEERQRAVKRAQVQAEMLEH